jgi:hypothetical protein
MSDDMTRSLRQMRRDVADAAGLAGQPAETQRSRQARDDRIQRGVGVQVERTCRVAEIGEGFFR